jgi:RNA polymerase-binding protein DksA
MADQGTAAQEREKAFLFASREGKYLSYLDRALERIKAGTYGFCQECGQPIAKARLEAVPTARLCINCKAKQEESNNA